MPPGIPQHVSAARAVSGHQRFAADLPLAQLKRLAAQLAETAGALAVDLAAGKDEQGHARLSGTIRGELRLMCQRGLHPFGWTCDLSPDLTLVASEAEEKRLMSGADAYLVEDDRLPLRDLVEDEVLLALPMMPRCDDPDCVKHLQK